ncbi:MAG: hypothetical protein V4644_01335 [Patescibacteria group bacterium]
MVSYIQSRAHTWMLSLARASDPLVRMLVKAKIILAGIGFAAGIAAVAGLTLTLALMPDTARALILPALIGFLMSLFIALAALALILFAAALIAVGLGFPPSRFEPARRFALARAYFADLAREAAQKV